MKARDIPNLICLLRILLVPPIVWLLLTQHYAAALILFALAGASDGLDGFLARRFEWRSRLGEILDPLADKMLMVASYATLGYVGLLSWWLVLLVLLRDVVIISGALAYHRFCGEVEMVPSRISKVNTVLQIALVLLVMVATLLPSLPTWTVAVMSMCVAATTLWSGSDYVKEWTLRARRCRHESGEGM